MPSADLFVPPRPVPRRRNGSAWTATIDGMQAFNHGMSGRFPSHFTVRSGDASSLLPQAASRIAITRMRNQRNVVTKPSRRHHFPDRRPFDGKEKTSTGREQGSLTKS